MALFSCKSFYHNLGMTKLNRIPLLLKYMKYAQTSTGVPKVVLKKYKEPECEEYEIRNKRLKRPLSPHLTIYAWELTSILSLGHRTTGIILSSYFIALGTGAIILPNDISHYIATIEGIHLSAATIFIAKALIAAPFTYHFTNGIRHLYWDTARGLSMKEVYYTGYAMLCVTAIITLILASL